MKATGSFDDFAAAVDPDARLRVVQGAVYTISNASGDSFHVLESEILDLLGAWREHSNSIVRTISQHPRFDTTKSVWDYQEKPYREAFARHFQDPKFDAVMPLARSQTRSLVMLLSKYVGWRLGRLDCGPDDRLLLDAASLDRVLSAPRTV